MFESNHETTGEKPLGTRNIVITECRKAVQELGLEDADYVFTREASMLANGILESTEEDWLEVVASGFRPRDIEDDWSVTPIDSGTPYHSFIVGYELEHDGLPHGIRLYFPSTQGVYGFLRKQMHEYTHSIEGVNFLTLEGLLCSERNIEPYYWNERATQNIKIIRRKKLSRKVLSLLGFNS